MKRTLIAALLVAAVCLGAHAGEANPPLLCDAPPACQPAPVCAPAPQVCPEPVRYKTVAVKDTVYEVRAVPVKRKIYEEENYVVNETRTETLNEVQTRTATRKVPVASTKEVATVRLDVVDTGSGRSPRLARTLTRKVVPTTVYVTEEFEETVTVPVKRSYTMPVMKTRKVARTVEEVKTVTVPKTVTRMEMRAVR